MAQVEQPPVMLCFNVATAARPWNPCHHCITKRTGMASMWPRPRGRGIDAWADRAAARRGRFIGHGRAAVESKRPLRLTSATELLQCGHDYRSSRSHWGYS